MGCASHDKMLLGEAYPRRHIFYAQLQHLEGSCHPAMNKVNTPYPGRQTSGDLNHGRPHMCAYFNTGSAVNQSSNCCSVVARRSFMQRRPPNLHPRQEHVKVDYAAIHTSAHLVTSFHIGPCCNEGTNHGRMSAIGSLVKRGITELWLKRDGRLILPKKTSPKTNKAHADQPTWPQALTSAPRLINASTTGKLPVRTASIRHVLPS